MSDKERDVILEKIAKGCLGVDLSLTPTIRRVSVNVVDLKQALQAAYKYGKEADCRWNG